MSEGQRIVFKDNVKRLILEFGKASFKAGLKAGKGYNYDSLKDAFENAKKRYGDLAEEVGFEASGFSINED